MSFTRRRFPTKTLPPEPTQAPKPDLKGRTVTNSAVQGDNSDLIEMFRDFGAGRLFMGALDLGLVRSLRLDMEGVAGDNSRQHSPDDCTVASLAAATAPSPGPGARAFRDLMALAAPSPSWPRFQFRGMDFANAELRMTADLIRQHTIAPSRTMLACGPECPICADAVAATARQSAQRSADAVDEIVIDSLTRELPTMTEFVENAPVNRAERRAMGRGAVTPRQVCRACNSSPCRCGRQRY